MSQTVTSHASGWPLSQGVIVAPSGCLLSVGERPTGSKIEGMFADAQDCLMMEFRDSCRGIRPWDLQQLRPWVPNSSTWLPQRLQLWGAQMGAPRRRPMAIWMDSLDICKPSDEIGGAVAQAPDSFCVQASSCVFSLGSCDELIRNVKQLLITGSSQAFCEEADRPARGSLEFASSNHRLKAWEHEGLSGWCIPDGRMAREMRALPAADAKKAVGASMTALLIPRPPLLMGNEACVQEILLSLSLQIDSSMARRDELKDSNKVGQEARSTFEHI